MTPETEEEKLLFILWQGQGYNPASCLAQLRFKRGQITEAEMWKVINANIKVGDADVIKEMRKDCVVRKGDLVSCSDRHGVILRIDREAEEAVVLFFATKEIESFDLYNFEEDNFSTKGGRTTWFIEEF